MKRKLTSEELEQFEAAHDDGGDDAAMMYLAKLMGLKPQLSGIYPVMWHVKYDEFGGAVAEVNIGTSDDRIEFDGSDMFVVLDGKRIAKRGQRGTPHAGTWIPLEAGWQVLDGAGGAIEISYHGTRMQ